MNDDDRALIEWYFSGAAHDSDKLSELEALLRSDAQAVSFFGRMALLEATVTNWGEAKAESGQVHGSSALVADDSARALRRTPSPRVARGKRKTRTSSLIVYAASSLAAAAVLMAVLSSRSDSWSARIEMVEAEVTLRRAGASMEAVAGRTLQPGDLIETGTDGRAAFRFLGELTRVDIGSNTRVTLLERSGAKRIDLNSGSLRAEVAPQPRDRPLVVATPHARAEIVGTRFYLQAEAERTRLEVQEGSVRLAKLQGSDEVLVKAGQFAVASPDSQLAVASSSFETAKPERPERLEKVVYFHDFDSIPPGEDTRNELVRLSEAGGEVTAIASKPSTERTQIWKPDVAMSLTGVIGNTGTLRAFYTLPANMEIRVRIKSERPGEWGISQMPENPRFKFEHFYSGGLPVGTEWREIVLRPADVKPYRTEGHTRDLEPGVGIEGFTIVGFGTGRLFVDSFKVVALPAGEGR